MVTLATSGVLKDRVYKVRVAGIEFDSLDCTFEIEKTKAHEPNSCTLTVYNLSKEHRAQIEQLNIYDPKVKKKSTKSTGTDGEKKKSSKPPKVGNIRVEIEAGYKGPGASLIFRGDLRRGISVREGESWATTIEGEDGGDSVLSARVSESFPAGTPKRAVVMRCAEAMGVGLGNIAEVTDVITGTFSGGTVLDGSAEAELRGILRRMKLTYSIQNGVLQFQRVGRGTGNKVRAVVLSQDTGMIGTPSMDATGELTVQTLMIPNIAPGSYVLMQSEQYKGVYQIVGVRTSGDTTGDAWGHELSLLPG